MSFEDFIDNFKDIEGIRVVSFNKNTNSVYYELLEEKTQKEIVFIVENLHSMHGCDVFLRNPEKMFYKLIIGALNIDHTLTLFSNQVKSIVELQKNTKTTQLKELGLPDLSLVTIYQMTNELKSRKNLVFSLFWVESNEHDNIAIEGSGNPNQILGLLARGTHMAIEWAEKYNGK